MSHWASVVGWAPGVDLRKELYPLNCRAAGACRVRACWAGVGGVHLVGCHRPPPGEAGLLSGQAQSLHTPPGWHSDCGSPEVIPSGRSRAALSQQ